MWIMFIKDRFESRELIILRILGLRGELTEKEKYQLWRLERGYEGEVKFDQCTKNLGDNVYVINDLLLEVNDSWFQIDTVLISHKVRLIDVKNYDGDYILKDRKLYSIGTNNLCKNPLEQLRRSENLFLQLLQKYKYNIQVEAKDIFINPNFFLYQAPIDEPFIFPSQVNQYVDSIKKNTNPLNDRHKRLAELLISLHQTENPYAKIPSYDEQHLKKGPYCVSCKSFHVFVEGRNLICGDCGAHEDLDLLVLRMVNEYNILFPDKKITTQGIYEWCGGVISRKTIRRVLKDNFKGVGKSNSYHYE
jgi:hypothetical protein